MPLLYLGEDVAEDPGAGLDGGLGPEGVPRGLLALRFHAKRILSRISRAIDPVSPVCVNDAL